MDNTDAAGSGTSDATATAQPGSSTGSEPVASDGSQGQENNAGGSQGQPEDGGEQGTDTRRPQFRSKNQTIYELRQAIRDRDSQLKSFEQRFSQLEQKFQPRQEQKPQRTFYEAPEDTLREILSEQQKSLKEELLSEFRQTQEQRESAQALKQEASEAAKFIRGQKGITEDDIQDIREILATDPVALKMSESPMEQAEYVMYRWEKQRGIADKSGLKAKAASVQGAPSQGGGAKTWTESEMETEYKKLGDPKHWTKETKEKAASLEREFMSAYSEKRVKK